MAVKVRNNGRSQRRHPERPTAEGDARIELGRRLERLRQKANFSQASLGSQLGVSQKLIDLWESGARTIPAKVAHWLDRMERGGDEVQPPLIASGGIDPRLYKAAYEWMGQEAADEVDPPLTAGKQPGRFSWPKKVFKTLWDHANIRAKGLTVRAFLAPSDTDGYADALMIMRFKQLETLGEEHLRLDHLCGNPTGPTGPSRLELIWPIGPNDAALEELLGMPQKRAWNRLLELSRGADWKERPIQDRSEEQVNFRSALAQPGARKWEELQRFIKRKKIGASQAEIAEDEEVKSTIGPHAVSYEIWNARMSGDDTVTVFLKAEYGFKLSEIDAIGFPLYPDLLLENIDVEMHLLGLRPEPDPPTTEPYLIRRNSNRAVPSRLGIIKELTPRREERGEDVVYAIHLNHPKPGLGYLLSWRRIVPFAGQAGAVAPKAGE
jgi:transcriptional regulator with XRE-family HTH domain